MFPELTIKTVTLLLLLAILQACSPSGGGYGYGDGPPPRDVDVSKLPDAVPKIEPITKAGNPNPYTVLGKTYHLLPVGAAYKERGTASWYGNKFHGRKTSNGETYNMYAMTAAHKTLRIPGYVRVTNLENGRSVIVRVNDRGPFHGDRIIDLSYAAAKKLDYSDKGTARVEVVAIDPRNYGKYQPNAVVQPAEKPKTMAPVVATAQTDALSAKPPLLPSQTFLQVGAFSSEWPAVKLLNQLRQVTDTPLLIRQQHQPKTLFKVWLGPVNSSTEMLALRNLLQQMENLRPFVVYD